MIYLILCILCCSVINVIFKYADKNGRNSFYIILINYLFASITGISTSKFDNELIKGIFPENIFLIIFSGVLFIVMIYLISMSVARAGVSKTAIATRMSMVIPVLFSYFFFNEDLTLLKIIGIITALSALYLTLYKKESTVKEMSAYFLPVIIFFGAGSIDTIIKYSQEKFVDETNLPLFSTLIFAFAGITGVLVLIVRKMPWGIFKDKLIWIYGGILGIANYGTVYFIVKALEMPELPTSVVFGINHIGIVLLSVFAAWILFKEKLIAINWLGVLMSILAIILLIY